MLEVEVLGAERAPGLAPVAVDALCQLVASRLDLHLDDGGGHVAVEFVDAARISELNERWRGKRGPTDVLSFPVDGVDGVDGVDAAGEAGEVGAGVPRELGDVVICPQHTADLREAVVHGMLHLLGMDHETDDGEMLALQRELLARAAK